MSSPNPELLHQLFDNMLEGCQILDRDWRYIALNAAAERHNRRPNTELIGRRYTEMWPGVEQNPFYPILLDCMENGVPGALENRFRFADGYEGWYELRVEPIPDGVLIMSLDITQRVAAREELDRLQEDLQLSNKLKSLGRLAGGIAHDFNNMLGVILGNAELACSKSDHPCPEIETILKAARRSQEITGQLLAFARSQPITPQVVDFNEIIQSHLQLLKSLIGENIALVWTLEPELGAVLIDPAQVHQILTNLVINARDAISRQGTIRVETRNVDADRPPQFRLPEGLTGPQIMLQVSDDGCGMSAEQQTLVYDPFYTTKNPGQGTGLGLATVFGIVKQNGGHIDVQSELGRGTTFRILLPRAEHAPKKPGTDHTPARNGTAPDAGCILVVEDEELLLELTERFLADAGYEVFTASSLADGLVAARRLQGKLDMVLTDVILPDGKGPELGELLHEEMPDLALIYMSGYTADVALHEHTRDGHTGFLTKPFTREELIDLVQEILAART